MKAIILISTSLVLSGSILSTAKAAPSSDVPTAVVKLRDLDITHAAGKAELYRRLMRAARAVCSPGGVVPESAGHPSVRGVHRPGYLRCGCAIQST